MDVKELRIGNWIFNGIGEEFQTNGETINNFSMGQAMLGAFKPIPLTEEWFLKFGFEEKGRYNFYNKTIDVDANLAAQIGYHIVFREKGFTVYELEYVHTLQNLVFALNKTELKTK